MHFVLHSTCMKATPHQPLRQSTVLWAALSLLPAQGRGRWCSEVQRPFPEVLSQWLYNLWVFNFLRISNWHLSCCLRTFHPRCLSGPFREQAGKLQVRDGWGWGELSTVFDHRARFSHSTQACGEEEKRYEISPRLSSIASLTAGLGFTGYAQALWKSFLLKNLTFFRFLAELTQLLEPFTRSEPFRQCSPVPLLHANPPSRELPCSSSGCSSLLVLLCSYPLLLTALFP